MCFIIESIIRWLKRMLLASSVFILMGCLASTHHFRKGKLLPSGESEVNWGYSYSKSLSCKGQKFKDEKGFQRCQGENWKEITNHNVSRSYRLGVRNDWGPFVGAELGYQMETNGVLEFDFRLGLPKIPHSFFENIDHAVGIGWGVGGFPDNTYFIDYAISREYKHHTIYATFRESLLATQFIDLEQNTDPEEGEDLFKHRQRLLHQIGLGMEYRLPDINLIPDQIHLQGLVTGPFVAGIGEPKVSSKHRLFAYQINVGLGWHY